jgi:hypothetical protein
MKSAPAPAAPNVAASGEYAGTRAKRQDLLAKETGEASLSAAQNLIVTPPPVVEMRLAVTDRADAEREIVSIVERLGGAMVTPSPGTLEVMVPNRAFTAFTGDLTRLGTLRIVRQPADLPDSVRISLRLTD